MIKNNKISYFLKELFNRIYIAINNIISSLIAIGKIYYKHIIILNGLLQTKNTERAQKDHGKVRKMLKSSHQDSSYSKKEKSYQRQWQFEKNF